MDNFCSHGLDQCPGNTVRLMFFLAFYQTCKELNVPLNYQVIISALMLLIYYLKLDEITLQVLITVLETPEVKEQSWLSIKCSLHYFALVFFMYLYLQGNVCDSLSSHLTEGGYLQNFVEWNLCMKCQRTDKCQWEARDTFWLVLA